MQDEEKKPIDNPEDSKPPGHEHEVNTPSTDGTVEPEPEPSAEPVLSSTLSPQPSTAELMEVHHHAHHEHGKKNWKSYFWEFLMLFLAVFCGFLAEYQLEHKIERDREQQYMASLYQDLKTDTLNLSALIKSNVDDIANYDSLFGIFKNEKYLQETSGAYFFGRKVVTLRTFYPTDGTITQLESSGGLRLIRNRAIVDSIQSYKQQVSLIKSVQDFEREHFVVARSVMGKIFDANVFDIMMGDGSSPLARPDKNYPLMPFTAAELNEFHIPMGFIKRNKITQVAMMKRLQKKAADLMSLLKEKYNLDEE
jgi:hypothetical protein